MVRRHRRAGQRDGRRRGPTQGDQPDAEGEATLVVAAHQAVGLEGDGQAVGRGPGESGQLDQLTQRPGRLLQAVQQLGRLVDDADPAYT
jgi:hypothetical protein